MGGAQSGRPDPKPGEVRLSQNDTKIQDIAHVLDVKAKSQNALQLQQSAINMAQYEQDKENIRLLRGLFKILDPAVVRLPGQSYGQLQLSVRYDTKRQLLLVKIIQCRDLHSRDVRTKASDPYVKVQLYPDFSGHGAKMTQIVVKTRDPVFNEIFAFRTSEAELCESCLIAQVWDYDVSKHDDFLGEIILPTAELNLDQGAAHTTWCDLTMETDLSVSGELSVTLSYQQPGTLFVTVHRAQGLSPRSGTCTAQPFVKVALPGVGGVLCSQVLQDTLNPEWEETFEFEIAEEELSWRYMVFHVVDQGSAQTENLSMGQAVLDLQVMTSQPNFYTTLTLADLRNSDHRLRRAHHQQVVTQELREACLAHTATRHPTLLFSPHQAQSKRVKVSCRKAGRTTSISGQMRIMDGVPVF